MDSEDAVKDRTAENGVGHQLRGIPKTRLLRCPGHSVALDLQSQVGNYRDFELEFLSTSYYPVSKDDRMAKSTCSVTRAEFINEAKPVEITVNGIPMTAEVKEFSTGSLGWYLNGKTNVKVGDKSVSVQIGMNLTIVGSKELPKE